MVIDIRWKITIALVRFVRRLSKRVNEMTYRIVPAICQDCFDLDPLNCKSCDMRRSKAWLAYDIRSRKYIAESIHGLPDLLKTLDEMDVKKDHVVISRGPLRHERA